MTTLRRIASLVLTFWLALSGAQAYAQAYLTPSQDTWLNEQSSNSNYGGDDELRARSRNNGDRRPLIQFDLSSIAANANVTDGELWLYASRDDNSGNPVNIYHVTDNWNEYSADWNNAANDYDSTVHASFAPTNTGWYRIDVTDLVQSWVCGDFDNDGIMLIPTSFNDESRYISRDYYQSYYHPRLYVTTSGTGGCAPPPPPPVVADWHLDECDLGIAGSTITDYGPNGLDATTVGGVDVENDGQLCSAGEFDGTSGYASVPDSSLTDVTGGFSVAVWVRHDSSPLKSWEAILAKGDSAFRLHLNGGCEISDTLPGNVQYGFTLGLNGGCDSADLNSNVVPQSGVWYHVAATYDESTINIYVDGVLLSSASYNQPIGTNNYDLFIGENSQQRGRYWSGDIDELTVWNGAISATEVVGHMNRTRPCTNCSNVSFAVVHDGYGIHCLDEVLEIQVVDSLTGNPRTDYTDQITLDTQNGFGTWTLVSGGGTFDDATAGDGQATYDWPLGESTAQFALSYPQGPVSVDVDVYQTSNTTLRDDDTEGTLEYSASGFTFSEAPLSNPPGAVTPFSSPRTAGTTFPVYLTAYGQTPDDPVCGVIETYTGPQNLKFWFTRDDPSTGSVNVTIDAVTVADNEAGAAAQAVTFTNGQAAVDAKYKDAGRIFIGAKDDSVVHADLPNGIRGATASFPVKPYRFRLDNIEDAGGNPNPVANGPSGPVFTAAGAPFSVTVTALDAEGDVTPNYGRESAPETVRLTANLVAPAVGNNPAIAQSPGFGPFAAGSATGNTFSWPEVGIVTLSPSVGDGDYLGGGDVVGTASGNVGRFIPDRFLAAGNVPEFGTTCTAGSFSYLGEPLLYVVPPVVTFTAVAVGGSQTANYTGAFFKVDNSTLQNRNYTAAFGSLDLAGLPPASADPVVADTGGGGSLTFDSGTGLVFQRGSPEAPFDADIGLGIGLLDADGVASDPDPVTFSTIAFSDGANIRYGRVRITNALGSELVNLAVPMHVEYFVDAATGFVPHTDDICTDAVTITLGNFTNNLQAGETCVVDNGSPGASGAGCAAAGPAGQRFRLPALGGDFNLFLQAPGAGNDGSVRVFGDVPAWLEYDWNGSSPGLEDPQGIATFGIFDDNGKRIYTREIYR